MHQFLHFVPAAFELAESGEADVRIFVAAPDEAAFVSNLADALGYPAPAITVMDLPGAISALLGEHKRRKRHKGLRLALWSRRLRDADALLCAERTTTLLQKLPGRCPPVLHIPHGAGDRAKGFEPRIAMFDHVVTVGEKDRDYLVAEDLMPPSRVHVGGPVKLAAIAMMQRPTRLFENDRPIVLYNPHFDADQTSFEIAGRLVDQVVADGRYNLVMAPHVRLAERWPAERVARWEARSVPGRVIVDMGSRRSADMTYTLGADLYLGDVSSQIYEFIARPRPCLLVDTHRGDWQEDPNYAMWHFGPVVGPDADFPAEIARAFETHARYRPYQEERARTALGPGAELLLHDDREAARSVIAGCARVLASLIPPPSDR